MRDLPVEEILATPGLESSLSGNEAANFRHWLDQQRNAEPESTLMNIFVGFGAWISALFIMSFVFAALTVAEEAGAIVCGFLLYAAATVLLRKNDAAFPRQLGLAFALAGNLLSIGGLVMLIDSDHGFEIAIILQALMILVTHQLIPSNAFRFIMVAAFHGMCVAWCLFESQPQWLNLLLLAQLVFSAGLFHPRLPASLQPAIYATVLAMPAELIFVEFLQQFHFMSDEISALRLLPATVFMTIAMLAVLWRVVRYWQLPHALEISILLPLALFALLTDIGIATGLLLLFSAYALADRWLGIAAAMVMPVFLFFHYYALDITLLQKSMVLVASGLLLLAMRQLLGWQAGKHGTRQEPQGDGA